MRELISKSTIFVKVEFWAFSTFCVFILFSFLTGGLEDPSLQDPATFRLNFKHAGIPFDFDYNYFIPQLIRNLCLFASFFYLNFRIIPRILVNEERRKNVMILGVVFIMMGVVFSITDTYIRGFLLTSPLIEDEVYRQLFESNFVMMLQLFGALLIYQLIKYIAIYLITKADNIYARYKFFTLEGIVAFCAWTIILFVLVLFGAETEVVITWVIFVLSAILLYLYSFYSLIPRSVKKKYAFISYFIKCLLVLIIAFMPVMMAITVIYENEDRGVLFSLFNCFLQLFVTAPITWWVYKRKMKGNEEITHLQKELNQTTASIDFLRSQINPHFLFNALNTLYGTALQENAERTGEGIQKLGDMMRFMLQENMQEKISLSREIDYLENYISLQRLRTDHISNIDIRTSIHNHDNVYQVAPMLLIPFVENAFKHGISLREPSHIKVTLEVKNGVLDFDVHNSKHERNANDPEKDKSGIGLDNVKQRLLLSYPGKHELFIRENHKEFFIHLTIQLT